ncbi:MAG: glycosyltransferase family 4 protein [Nitrososphaeraceae archaeon]
MRILWYNWRDIKNPEAGGAEVLTHEISTRLIKKYRHDITLFTSKFNGASRHEYIDGVHVIREGGRYTVYEKAKAYYKGNRDSYELIIDEINVKPFLTPKYVKKEKPILALIHQISPEQFIYELPFPLSILGRYYLERKWLSYYKDIPTVTVSRSTMAELEKIGIQNIFLVPEGLGISPLTALAVKETVPTIVFIGRLKKHKLPHHAIQAFMLIKNEIPAAKLWVIGDGYMRKQLEGLGAKDTKFYGHIDNTQKYEFLRRAHLVLMPGIREGWGLVVTEANAMGTPVVAYDIPGLRDSVRDGSSGILVKENTPIGLASSAISLLRNAALLDKLSLKALAFSRQFSWERSADIFNQIIDKVADGGQQRKEVPKDY